MDATAVDLPFFDEGSTNGGIMRTHYWAACFVLCLAGNRAFAAEYHENHPKVTITCDRGDKQRHVFKEPIYEDSDINICTTGGVEIDGDVDGHGHPGTLKIVITAGPEGVHVLGKVDGGARLEIDTDGPVIIDDKVDNASSFLDVKRSSSILIGDKIDGSGAYHSLRSSGTVKIGHVGQGIHLTVCSGHVPTYLHGSDSIQLVTPASCK
jgi:hypothetical protein